MRLYLSSENVGRHADRLVELVGDNKTVVYIPNARDSWISQQEKQLVREKTAAHKAQFEGLGFTFEYLDLKDYFEERKLSEKDFKDAGLVWAPGGNTFMLRRAMYDSGFDQILKKLLQQDALVYGGSSAGAIVATPSLHGTEIGDRPQDVQDIYDKEVLWDGLGLINKYLSVHMDSEWFKEESKRVGQYFEHKNLPYVGLRDGQVLLVDGAKEEFLP